MNKDKDYLLKYWSYLKEHKTLLTLAFILIPLISFFNVIQPVILKKAIDDYILQGNMQGLYLITIIYSACVILDFVCKACQSFLFQFIGQKTVTQIRENLFKHLLQLSSDYYDKTPIGTVTSRLTSDIESLNDSFASGLVTLITDLLTLTAIIVMMFLLSPKLTFITLTIVPPMILIVNFFRIKLRNWFNIIRTTIGKMNGFIQEHLQGIITVQHFQQENNSFNQFNTINKKYKHATLSSVSYDAMLYSLIESINSIMIALMIWYGWGQYQNDIITIGLLVAFIEYIHKFFVPLKEISTKFAILQHALAALEKIFSTFEISDILKSGTNTPSLENPSIIFKNVSFSYKRLKEKQILKSISFKIQPGEVVALVGPTGSGKTSILRLLSRLYDGYSGEIYINNNELSTLDLKKSRKSISVVNQDIHLFSNSIEFNIRLGNPNISYERMIWAAKQVNIHEFIMSLENNYNTVLNKGTHSVSVGQAQLITFARALANPSPIMILDEATSSVDSITEKSIQKGLETLLKEKTSIVVAHRLSTIQKANLILVLKGGEIIEYGNHNNLIKNDGLYARLFNIQFK